MSEEHSESFGTVGIAPEWPSYNTPYRSHHLRAKGNLTYPQFIRLVQQLWHEVNPRVPIIAIGGQQIAKYPSIVYSLQMRKTHPSEPKPKYREEIRTNPGEDSIIIGGQRFQNVINFTVVTELDPELAEDVIEAFEDFMLEYVPVFKELGLSEMVYARRLPDDEQPRIGEGVTLRTVSFLVTTEKIILTSHKKLNSVLVRARTALDSRPTFSANEGGYFAVSGMSFNVGDKIVLSRANGNAFPGGVAAETIYYIKTVFGNEDGNLVYQLTDSYGSDFTLPVDTAGVGYVGLVTPAVVATAVPTEFEDNFQSATPTQ